MIDPVLLLHSSGGAEFYFVNLINLEPIMKNLPEITDAELVALFGYSLGDLYAVMQTHDLESVDDAIKFVMKKLA